MSNEAHERTQRLFDRAKRIGLVGFNGDGAPTFEMIKETILEAENDLTPEVDELAAYVRRLARLAKKTNPDSSIISSAMEFLKCAGHSKILR